MSRFVFLFDLDSTITQKKIMPAIFKELGMNNELQSGAEERIISELPFKQKFLKQVELIKQIPVHEVHKIVNRIKLNEAIVQFICNNSNRCYIVTENLDVWIEPLMQRISMLNHVYCSKSLVQGDYIQDIFSITDKSAVISQMVMPYVAIGNGNSDAEMMESAEIGIGYGGVSVISPSVLECASHVIYNENKLVEFLEMLL